jgi:hypothetical protein
MQRTFARLLLMLLVGGVFSMVASADSLPVGILSLDNPSASTSGQFDITNLTGANALLPDFPVTTGLTFVITSLTVNFASGPADVLHAVDFTSDGNGGFVGNTSFNLSTTDIISAILVGTLSPTGAVDVSGGGTITIEAAMTDKFGNPSVTLTDGGTPLVPGDLAVLYATPSGGGGPPPVPEPGVLSLLGSGLMGLSLLLRRGRVAVGR